MLPVCVANSPRLPFWSNFVNQAGPGAVMCAYRERIKVNTFHIHCTCISLVTPADHMHNPKHHFIVFTLKHAS